uniref:Uncharacterized protein n=1 Tax=Magallana gigas TaxID=29159 RepID=K1QWW8_MAGGI
MPLSCYDAVEDSSSFTMAFYIIQLRSGIAVRTQLQCDRGCLGAALRPPVGPGQSTGGGPGGEAPGSSWVFVYFEGLDESKQE